MFKTWTKFEKIWVGVFIGLILAVTTVLSLSGTDYSSTNSILLNWVISPISAITGVMCVVLVGKGSKWNYSWGLVNCLTYGYLAYKTGYYGDAILNIFYFLPFQFIGYYYWNRHLRNNSNEFVVMKKLTLTQGIYITLGSIVATVLVGLALFNVDHWFTTAMKRNVSIYTYLDNTFHIPYLGAMFDASTEVLQIVAQILMTLAFAEQWILWILTNVITIIMWGTVLVADPTSIPWALPTLIMWCAYFCNSVWSYGNWLKGATTNVN